MEGQPVHLILGFMITTKAGTKATPNSGVKSDGAFSKASQLASIIQILGISIRPWHNGSGIL